MRLIAALGIGLIGCNHVVDVAPPPPPAPPAGPPAGDLAPIVWNGLVLIGNAGGDFVGVTGHVYALDANDGHTVWRFDVVPTSGPARATWDLAPNHPLSGGAFWTSFTLDEANGVLYVPAGNPAPDFDLALRRGANLYSNSVIALDAMTGIQSTAQHDLRRHG